MDIGFALNEVLLNGDPYNEKNAAFKLFDGSVCSSNACKISLQLLVYKRDAGWIDEPFMETDGNLTKVKRLIVRVLWKGYV